MNPKFHVAQNTAAVVGVPRYSAGRPMCINFYSLLLLYVRRERDESGDQCIEHTPHTLS